MSPAAIVVTDSDRPLARRLVQLADGLEAVLAAHRPDEAAVEETFVNRNAGFDTEAGPGARHRPAGTGTRRPAGRRVPAEPSEEDGGGHGPCGKGAGADDDRRAVARCALGSADAADALAVAICHAHHRGASAMAARVAAGRTRVIARLSGAFRFRWRRSGGDRCRRRRLPGVLLGANACSAWSRGRRSRC